MNQKKPKPKSIVMLKIFFVIFFSIAFLKQTLAQCRYTGGSISITGNVVWDATHPPPNPLDSEIVIWRGGSLTISGVTVNIDTTADIRVEVRGKLIIKNSTLRLNPGCSGTWQGIEVTGWRDTCILGDCVYSQYAFDNTTGTWVVNPLQSLVSIDSSTIRDADNGVLAESFGIVRATNSTFIDNGTGIAINQSGISSTYDYNLNNVLASANSGSADLIQNCVFDHHSLMYGESTFGGRDGIFLDFTNYIEIAGNTFTCSYGGTVPSNNRGFGIHAQDASFFLHDQTTVGKDPTTGCVSYSGNRNTFQNLNYGVWATKFDTSAWAYHCSFNHCLVTNCIHAMVLEFGHEHSFYNNDITWNNATATSNFSLPLPWHPLVEIDDASNNIYFKNHTTTDDRQTIMLYFNDCGTDPNLITHNSFVFNGSPSTFSPGDREYATAFSAENRNTIVECDSFVGNLYDIDIEAGGHFVSTMGSSSFGEHNYFSAPQTLSQNILNNSSNMLTYHFKSAPFNPIHTSGLVSAIGSAANDGTCPEITSCKKWPTGINEFTFKHKPIELYPNPAKNNITIDFGTAAEEFTNPVATLMIMDINGKMIRNLTANMNQGEINIRTDTFSPGIYFYRINWDSNMQESGKFVIER